jgi:flagellar biosynthesis protein FlhF
MRIKKYTAKSMKDALLQIKQELGDDAVILKTTRVPKKLFGQGDIEVIAAVDEDTSGPRQSFPPLRVSDPAAVKRPTPAMPEQTINGQHSSTGTTFTAAYEKNEAMTRNTVAKAPPLERRREPELKQDKGQAQASAAIETRYAEIKPDINELKRLFKTAGKKGEAPAVGGFSSDWAVMYEKLVEAEMPERIAQEFVSRLQGEKGDENTDAVKKFAAELDNCFRPPVPRRMKTTKPLIVMFVGPTGAGKTTTLAKLAAHHVLSRRRSIAVITADTYRIAAIEQIRTFAEIMNMELFTVFSPQEAGDALAKCSSNDIVFVDTAGRSQKSSEHMQELQDLIEKMKPDEIHLVLSATTKISDLTNIIEKYRPLGVNRLLFTKLDETMKIGNVFTMALQSKIPFSYFTFGQRVPDDIELAQPSRLLSRLFEGSEA